MSSCKENSAWFIPGVLDALLCQPHPRHVVRYAEVLLSRSLDSAPPLALSDHFLPNLNPCLYCGFLIVAQRTTGTFDPFDN